jgi:hypothetical protein
MNSKAESAESATSAASAVSAESTASAESTTSAASAAGAASDSAENAEVAEASGYNSSAADGFSDFLAARELAPAAGTPAEAAHETTADTTTADTSTTAPTSTTADADAVDKNEVGEASSDADRDPFVQSLINSGPAKRGADITTAEEGASTEATDSDSVNVEAAEDIESGRPDSKVKDDKTETAVSEGTGRDPLVQELLNTNQALREQLTKLTRLDPQSAGNQSAGESETTETKENPEPWEIAEDEMAIQIARRHLGEHVSDPLAKQYMQIHRDYTLWKRHLSSGDPETAKLAKAQTRTLEGQLRTLHIVAEQEQKAAELEKKYNDLATAPKAAEQAAALEKQVRAFATPKNMRSAEYPNIAAALESGRVDFDTLMRGVDFATLTPGDAASAAVLDRHLAWVEGMLPAPPADNAQDTHVHPLGEQASDVLVQQYIQAKADLTQARRHLSAKDPETARLAGLQTRTLEGQLRTLEYMAEQDRKLAQLQTPKETEQAAALEKQVRAFATPANMVAAGYPNIAAALESGRVDFDTLMRGVDFATLTPGDAASTAIHDHLAWMERLQPPSSKAPDTASEKAPGVRLSSPGQFSPARDPEPAQVERTYQSRADHLKGFEDYYKQHKARIETFNGNLPKFQN